MINSLTLGDRVIWTEAPGSISDFGKTNVRGLSPCGKYALLDWIRNPVHVSTLEHVDSTEGRNSRPRFNHWQDSFIDASTRESLEKWRAKNE